MVDEVDEVVASVPGSGAILEFLASKQRKSAVCLILATQRATQKQTGGGMVRANLSQVVIGNTNRATESRHATGAEAEIPDISEYSRGRKGYFQVWDPQAKEITARGRTFLLGVPPDELAYCKRIVDARKGTRRTLPAVELAVRDRQEHAPEAAAPGVSEMRARLAAARERNESTPAASAAARRRPVPARPGCPRRARRGAAGLLGVLAAPRGHPAEAGLAIGMSKSAAHRYLSALRDARDRRAGRRPAALRLAVAAAPRRSRAGRRAAAVHHPGRLAEAVHDGGWLHANDEQPGQSWSRSGRSSITAAAPDQSSSAAARPGTVTRSDRSMRPSNRPAMRLSQSFQCPA